MVAKPTNWSRRLVLLVVALTLGSLTAITSDSSPGIQILFEMLVPALFLSSFILVELFPAWRRDPTPLTKRRVFWAISVFLFFAVVYLLVVVRRVEDGLGGGKHPWLFILYFVLFMACAEFFKIVYERTR